MQVLLGSLFMALVPAYFVLQVLMLVRYSGRWRMASAAPLVLLVPAVLFSAFALASESNLWPLAVIFSAPFACLVLVVIGTAHWFRRGRFI
jgi:phosphoglycerol transferase MdoB-like AlkP superfamily enzyme